MTVASQPILRADDFASMEIEIRLRNTVSQTRVDATQKTIGDIPMGKAPKGPLIQILEINPEGLVLSVPRYTCAKGHALELEIRVSHLDGKSLDIRLSGKAKEVEKTSGEQEHVEIVIHRADRNPAWVAFARLLRDRQEEIHDFFRNVRGY